MPPRVPRPFLRLAARLARRRDIVEAETDEEIRFHLATRAAALVARGLTPEHAQAEALRRFGPFAQSRASMLAAAKTREERLTMLERLDALRFDLAYAFRQFRRAPGFAAAVIATLALGIGANATMFGIVDRLLLRPPAYLTEAGRTHRVYLGRSFNGRENLASNMSYARYRQLAEWNTTLVQTAGFFNPTLIVGTGDQARQQRVSMVSASFWPMFDAHPALGRFFTADEDRVPSGAPVAVLGYGYWASRYGGSRAVLGAPIIIGSRAYTIIGVAPPGFVGTSLAPPVAFIPITAGAGDLFGGSTVHTYHTGFNWSWLQMLARRKPGVSLGVATADLTAAFQRSYLAELAEDPSSTSMAEARPHVVVGSILPERGPQQRTDSRVATWLIGVSAIVLLIACANVANLLLARALRRRREIAVRIALGIGRGRLMIQLLTESLALALVGGVSGLLVAQWGGRALRAVFLPDVEMPSALSDPRMLLFAGVSTILVGLLTGLAPALQSSRSDVTAALKSGSREGTYHRSHLRNTLLVFQGALSVVLLTGAGLFVRSLHNVNALHLGYDVDHVLYVGTEMRGVTLDSAHRVALTRALLDRVRGVDGVLSATEAATVPFWISNTEAIFSPGIDSINRRGDFYLQAGSPSYFATMGTRILRGRVFTDADRAGAPRVMVVSQSMARKLWPGKDAVGRCVKVGADTMPCSNVVGIAEDIYNQNLRNDAGLQYYLPVAQYPSGTGSLFVRTRGDARTRTEAIRRELQRIMPGASYVSATPMQEILDPNVRPWQLGATMFTVFGALALLLAAVGLYSVLAYTVGQRTHEMGVRIALGARPGHILRLVIGYGLRIALAGTVLGTLVALAVGRFVESLLFHVSARDPIVLGAVIVTLIVVAIAATLIPALRASRLDPLVSLRAD